MVINNLSEVKEFDKTHTARDDHKHNEIKLHTSVKMPARKKSKYCGLCHQSNQCPAYGKKYMKCKKMNHFQEVCSKEQHGPQYIEQEAD